MNDLVIVDTDILIDVGRGNGEAVGFIRDLGEDSRVAVSVITQLELMIGCQNKKELIATERFLSRFEILNLNETISNLAVELIREYRLSHGLLIADALISATAICYDLPLVSKNQKDYRFVEKLNLLSYP